MRAFRVQEIAGGFVGSEDKGWLTKHGDANHVACNSEVFEMHGLWIDGPSHTISRGPGMELEPLFVGRDLQCNTEEGKANRAGYGEASTSADKSYDEEEKDSCEDDVERRKVPEDGVKLGHGVQRPGHWVSYRD